MEILYQPFALWYVWPAVIGFAVYWYSTRNYSYWKKLGIPSAPTIPFLGSIFGNFYEPQQYTEVRRYKAYGKIYGYYEADRPALTVADPELIRNILVKDFEYFTNRRKFSTGNSINDKMLTILEGEDWKRVRTIISPTFTTGKIKRMLDIFKNCAKTLCESFTAAAVEGKPVEVKHLYGTFTMDVIASSAFSTKIESHNDPNNRFVVAARSVFSRDVSLRFVIFFLWPSFMRFFKIDVFSPTAMNFFHTAILQIIQERKSTGQVRNDFLQLMLDTAKEEYNKEEENKTENEDIIRNYGSEDNDELFRQQQQQQKKTLSYDEMIAQCIIFFFAGYDTTASTLSFVSYNLALNPDCQEKLIKEVDQAINDAGGEITYEAIQKMKYLDNVISESLRLYPPAIRLERMAERDYKLGDTGITIPKGMIVGVPLYAMQRDPEFFPDPEKFDPERFNPEQKAQRNQYTYMPFGLGPRNCIAMRFALMEAKVCIAYVVSQFRIRRCSDTKVPLEFYRGAGILQPKAIDLEVERRNDAVFKM